MSSIAAAVHGTLEHMVQAHHVRASFPVDRLFNKLAFMTVVVQAVGIMAANFAATSKVTCTLDSDQNASDRIDRRSYAESFCYSRGIDQSGLDGNSLPTTFGGVLRHHLLQVYLPAVMILQAASLYLPYYVWSATRGESLRQNVQFVVELSKKLLKSESHCDAEDCKHDRLQHGRPSKADLLTEERLKRHLRRWYCKGKHTCHYYVFQLCRILLLLAWIGFYTLLPGFRHSDIRYQFLCRFEHNGLYAYWCVMLQASIFQVGWCTNMSILLFCLALVVRQVAYVFPFVLSCRCLQCRTKRCRRVCGKECKSHFFQRILGVVVEPKRPPGRRRPIVSVKGASVFCCCLEAEYQEMTDRDTDFWSPRLSDRYYISQLCYENAHLLADVLPDMSSANASDEFSSLGNLASIAMKLDGKSEEIGKQMDASLQAAESKAKRKLLGKFAAATGKGGQDEES